MKLRKIALVSMVVLLPFSAAACGDDSTGDLSLGEMSAELQKGGVPKESADCVAKALKKADFTEEDLKAITADPTSAKAKEYGAAIAKCVTTATP